MKYILILLSIISIAAGQRIRDNDFRIQQDFDTTLVADVVQFGITIYEKHRSIEKTLSDANKRADEIIQHLVDFGIPATQLVVVKYETSETVKRRFRRSNFLSSKLYITKIAITITLKDFSKLEPAIMELGKLGVNSIDKITYSIADPARFKTDVIRQTVILARQKAEMISSELEIELDELVSYHEGQYRLNGVMPVHDLSRRRGPVDDVGFKAGKALTLPRTIKVSCNVTLTYSVKSDHKCVDEAQNL